MHSARKQQSISAFFTTNSSNAIKTTDNPKAPLAPLARNKNGAASSDVDEQLPVDSNSRQRKRPADEDEFQRLQTLNAAPTTTHASKKRKGVPVPGETNSLLVQRSPSTNSTAVEATQLSSRKSKTVGRTSKYLFTGSSQSAYGQEDHGSEEQSSTDEAKRKERERLHQRFVKKLGQPNSLLDRKRKSTVDNSTAPDLESEGSIGSDAGEEAGSSKVAGRPAFAKAGRKGAASKKSSNKLTPMEKQVLEIKRKHMDTLLLVEVGYKFRFFGEDARVAAKELSIVCIPGKFRYDEHASEAHLDRFASASIPVHRLHVHVKRLVSAGHKVGVVRQLETAALKAIGDNRNAPFVRKLTNLYTKGTYIDDVQGLEGSTDGLNGGAPPTGYLLCITESNPKGWGTDEKVQVGILAVQPATGDIIYDDFDDGFMRSEIESRLLHLAPCELLVVGELSKATEKLVQHLSGSSVNIFGEKVRVERVEKPKTMAAQAYSHVSSFYAGKMKDLDSTEDENASSILDKILKLSEHVTICLSTMITHLSEYGLEHVFDLTKYFQPFSARSHMLLNGTTLNSLEIYQNSTDHSVKGSLFWCLDKTRTRFGQRLLRKWVGRPLLDAAKLEERLAAVDELNDSNNSMMVSKLKTLLSRMKTDLEKSLIRIYYGKCSRPELLGVLQAIQSIGVEFGFVKSATDTGFKTSILNNAIMSLPGISEDVVSYLEKINPEAAKKDDKYTFFRDDQETEEIVEHKLGIASVEHDLNAHRAVAAEKLRKKKVEYVTVAGIEYLIELENTQVKNVPASWIKISGTKKMSRFHTPEVIKLIRERDQHKEALAAACDVAFSALLADISSKYQPFRDCVQSLAVLDCLLSLAEVANQPGYVRPEFTDQASIVVEQGRHPMVEQLLLDAYVPNDITMSSTGTRALLVTGPNMGGKSSYVRQVALIAIMGQIGSYVPATSAKLGMFDAVFTRMGAFDNMMAGESTFMVELSETSDILKQATPRSLVILDELGRGTSTHDGVAIAHAVLDYLVRDKKCLTMFITHYQTLSTMARTFDNGELKNVHMRFAETGADGQEITFLYEVAEGVAYRSYGLNVARLANVPARVLAKAAIKSKELEDEVETRKMLNLSCTLSEIVRDNDADRIEQLIAKVEEL